MSKTQNFDSIIVSFHKKELVSLQKTKELVDKKKIKRIKIKYLDIKELKLKSNYLTFYQK